MSDLVETITQWLKNSTGSSSGSDRLEFAMKVDKAHRAKNARELAKLVEAFKRSGAGSKREILTHLSASNLDAYNMFATLGR